MLSFFSKEKEAAQNTKIPEDKPSQIKVENKPVIHEEIHDTTTQHKQDYVTEQCISMGMDIKNDVEKSSKVFFNSKNEQKAHAYNLFQNYLEGLENREVSRIKDLTYLEFKEKEEQITTTLKNGFAQFLTKGASLDEENKKIVNFVFLDIKKYPSKAHRYWYFKEYIWQKRELD